ncbi:MAG: SLBB domain-containing protein [Alphaproteobacteria bacterium]|nr:SLBB domain-containing protein [Alphaproteobacteria bacterium]
MFWASAALTTQSFAQNNEFYNAYTPYEITSPVQRKTHSSALEKLYTERLSQEIEQFGYDLFTDSSASSDFESEASRTPIGAIQDSFILGLGDELLITFTGQRSDQAIYRVTSQGHIIIKDIPPLPATGKTLAQLHDLLNAQLATMPNTQSYISLSKVRQIGVLVVGHVKKPGRKTLNAFHSIIEALNSAGGITKDGSLRQIKLVRAGHSSIIDLYALLLDGAPQTDMTLKDGDRLIIPPVGPTLAIAGSVKRPGVYEIKEILPRLSSKSTADQNEKLTLDEMLKLSGGVLIPGQNRFIRINPEPNGQENIDEIDTHTTPLFSNGSILNVMSGKAKRTGTIKLTGQTRKPGLHDLSRNKTLAKLLSNPDILDDDIYPLLGVIERWDTEQFSTQYISFPVRSVLKNKFDLSLSNNDVIKLFSNQEISTLFKAYTSNTKSIKNNSKDGGISNDIYKDDDVLKIYLKEQPVHVRGAVRHPGHYPVAQGITLDNILAVAGGMTLEANRDSIEITSANFGQNGQAHERSGTQRITISLNETSGTNYTLSAGDSVRVNQQYRKLEEKTVHIKGEILHPGEYNLLPSDTISSLIQRAGGLTEQAYPTGAIFSRKSERRAEELRFRKAARNMELSLANAVKNDKNRPDATQIEMVRSLAQELTRIQAVGRITVETDPAVLSVKPELDMLLEHGDRLYVPKRPLSVRVTGEVLSPSALQFISDKAPLNYIHEAGSFTFHADKDRAFVLYPNGSAQPLQVNTWNHKPIFIPPGSTIVVPRDPAPFSFIDGAREIAQILSNLAVTAVFIDDIRD